MSDLVVDTDGIRAYARSAAQSAEQIGSAGAYDLAANIAALTPVLGPIGADFLAAFAHAQSTHAQSVAELAAHYAGTAAAADSAAAGYDGTDRASGDALGGIGESLA
ncbi:ESX-1 secretion-associated protein [Rhodococcus rhodnii]|uniref:ESX-1 secretion-associated protein n=2 Tax=Rhodococcus rhodnii TaxID=38312 RepID=R7WKS0_9NOCA|nr:type VII secretion target [Rhodococcus rhodnii]EOM75898.1 hypothetical protein Rrhod_2810 [Rhodococcus rhodnii LMG 5362]TXG91062.1 ESX-1 secretion-associated protein [Rhodococcus rhodnii]